MTGETTLTITGHLTSDPQLRLTPTGAAVASFTVAANPRTYDRHTGEWRDGEALFLRCTLWRQAAEHAAESLTKGSRVIATGRLRQRCYTDATGIDRTVVELDVDELAASLRYATAKLTTTTRSSPAGGGEQEADSPAGGEEPPF